MLSSVKGHHAEHEHGGGVRDRDDGAQENRVSNRSTGADQIGGDESLAVAGSEGVGGAGEERYSESNEDKAGARVGHAQQRLKLLTHVARPAVTLLPGKQWSG